MKKYFLVPLIILFGFVMFFSSCFKEPLETDIPIYPSHNDIVYPPDTFQIVYNLNTYIDYNARVIFDTSGVWKIRKITAFSAMLWAEHVFNEDSVNSMIVYDSIYLGLDGEVFYDIKANNNSHPEARNFFVRFEKSNFNYEFFTPKL